MSVHTFISSQHDNGVVKKLKLQHTNAHQIRGQTKGRNHDQSSRAKVIHSGPDVATRRRVQMHMLVTSSTCDDPSRTAAELDDHSGTNVLREGSSAWTWSLLSVIPAQPLILSTIRC